MAQWMSLQWNKKFVNQMRLYLTCEKSGGLHLAEPGLTAGRLTVQQTKFGRDLKFYKLSVDRNIGFSPLFSALFQQL